VKRYLFALLIVALLGVLVIRLQDPRYHGYTLTHWLRQYDCTPLEETQPREEARNAVRAIGPQKALPVLLNLVEAKDDPVSLWLIARTGEFRIRFLRWSSSEHYSMEDYERSQWHAAEDFQQLGLAGFEIMGTNAAPVVGQLEKLLNEPDHVFTAKRCLQFIGKPAEFVLCRALTNQSPDIRQWAMDELASDTDEVGVYIARIKPLLLDPSTAVRVTAVNDIGLQTSAPELAVPILIQALQDSPVSASAASALANFTTNALAAVPRLISLAGNSDPPVAGAALQSLIAIAPEQSFPILTKAIAREDPGVDGAIRTLAGVAPDQALPLLLSRLQSTDTPARRNAFSLLSHYPLTPEIKSAMQAAAAGSDSNLAERAKVILTDANQRDHPQEGRFLDDPSYQGKLLGEWLKMRNPDGQLSPAATNAIHHLGAKAIPALLRRLAYVKPPFQQPAWEINMAAVYGLITLGEQAVPALPKLSELMEGTNQNRVLYAMVSSLGTGTNAIPILCQGLTNKFAEVRGEAADGLTEAIAIRFPDRRNEIIPRLKKLLNDPDPDVRQNVIGNLREINGTNNATAQMK